MSVVTSSSTEQTESNLQKERQLFRELFARLRDAVINNIFDLRPERAMQRTQYLIVLFFVSMFLVILTHKEYSLGVWAQYLRTPVLRPPITETLSRNSSVLFTMPLRIRTRFNTCRFSWLHFSSVCNQLRSIWPIFSNWKTYPSREVLYPKWHSPAATRRSASRKAKFRKFIANHPIT